MLNEQKPTTLKNSSIEKSSATTIGAVGATTELNQSNNGEMVEQSCVTCVCNQNQLDQSQTELAEQKKTCTLLRKDVERFKEELEREAHLRRDLEEQWQEKRESHKRQVQALSERVTKAERDFSAMQLYYADYKEEIKQEMLKLTAEREQIHRHLETLQSDNDFLAGKYLATSEDLQNQRIDLPNNVEDLQEVLLKCHENLIEARVGCEFEQRKSMSYFDEAQLLRDQLTQQYNERHSFERDVTARIKSLEYVFGVVSDQTKNLIFTSYLDPN